MKKRSTFDDVLSCFAFLGKPVKELSPDFTASLTTDWLLPSNSPIFLNRLEWTVRASTRLTRFFEKQQGRQAFTTDKPYFWVDRKALGRSAAFEKAVAADGFKKNTDRFQICLWDQRFPIELPDGYQFSVGSIEHRHLRADAEQISTKAFRGTEPDFWRRANNTLKAHSRHSAITVIYDRAGRPAASGIIIWSDTHSFMFSGGVHPKHEGRGLWRALVGIRQSLTPVSARPHCWALTTHNPRIHSKADRHLEVDVYQRV